ncbi:MAG: hypothetical protein M0R77_17635 [Gammaproteobacteria bacterium]|nr:hypothetical protein [Gammaproteobacteria bacterium]
MFDTFTAPNGEEYEFRLTEQLRPLDQRQWQIMDLCKNTNIPYVYWNGWFYFKTIEDYTTIILIF